MRMYAFDGTRRTRPPAKTWHAIRPLLPAYGITRIADVTGLDDLGIPVTMAVRPTAWTLSVAQGKGATLDAARVSGAMEAIEVWHAERAPLPVSAGQIPACDLRLPYAIAALEQHPGSLLTERVRMDWITARSAVDDAETLLPEAAVRVKRTVHDDWRLHLPSASTNGLASGNTRAEALVHGLCAVIERDVLSDVAQDNGQRSEIVDPATVADPHCAALIEKLRRGQCRLELRHASNRFGVAVMSCHLWREDQSSVLVAGAGAHPDPQVALSRAITEAAQSRLTLIAGSREDNQPLAYRPGPHTAPVPSTAPMTPWATVISRYQAPADTDTAQASVLAAAVATATGHAPLVVDLTWGPYAQDEFTVVKVCAPGLRHTARHTVPRPQETTR
ncbi:YcaO-like family protein [Streptomyces sp. NPDC059743]|uniref:YcaO-like family protein n=1 Tax=Streptomyces sp. NPDC059743 TaxID=3346928 RepID=UPI00364BC27A